MNGYIGVRNACERQDHSENNHKRNYQSPIAVDLHQGYAWSPYHFALIVDKLARRVHDEIPWCMSANIVQ